MGSKEGLVQICEDAYIGRKKKTYSLEVIKRTGQAAGLENTQQIDKVNIMVIGLIKH